MTESPGSLQECCIDYICANINAVIDLQDKRQAQLMLPGALSEKLLENLGEKFELDDRTLALFDSNINLKCVRLRNGSKLTSKGLRMLGHHKITELVSTNLTVPIAELIGMLGVWTIQNLHTLNVCGSEFNNHCLDIVVTDLPMLENLDISCTEVSDISPLRKCKDRLRSLSMYAVPASNRREMIHVVTELYKLRQLDISVELVNRFGRLSLEPSFNVMEPLCQTGCLPQLVSLDISGRYNIEYKDIRSFLDSHPSMTFLGLFATTLCAHRMFNDREHHFFRESLSVTGSHSEIQLVEAMRRYMTRSTYICSAIEDILQQPPLNTETSIDVIKLIVSAMRAYPKQIDIQSSATACLYRLYRNDIEMNIHPKWLRKIVDQSMVAMETFPDNVQLLWSALRVLCVYVCPEVSFDRYRCFILLMDLLDVHEDVTGMCIAICADLAFRITSEERLQLGARPKYINKLLKLAETKLEDDNTRNILQLTLHTLWNLTDECPFNSNVLLEQNGFNLILSVLQRCSSDDRTEVLEAALGLVGNIAEVKHLRGVLMSESLITHLRSFLPSSDINLSCSAARSIAVLASDEAEAWKLTSITRHQVLDELGTAVLSWKPPQNEIEEYRSLRSFFPLLSCDQAYEVQLWAVWVIHNICNLDYKRYCPMLIAEGVVRILKDLLESPTTNHHVRVISENILKLLQDKGPFYVSKIDLICT